MKVVSKLLEILFSDTQSIFLIVPDALNVFNNDVVRLSKLSKANHSEYQSVSRVITTGMVVQIAKTLAWRASSWI